MMEILQTTVITIVTLGILVTIHEFGHFWVARRCGVKVLRFSVGFGKALFTWRGKDGTEYAIAAIPLGGYVKMLDEREGEVAESELDQAFNRKPVLQRIAVVSAGPLANFVLAIVAFYSIYVTGVSGVTPVIDGVASGSVAEYAGLEVGQQIVAVDGEPTPTVQALSLQLLSRIGETGTIRFSAKYADSNFVYESQAQLDHWLADEEEPDLIKGLGITLYQPPIESIIDQVMPDSPAAAAGFKPGDKIIAADGVVLADWTAWVEYVRARPEQTIDVEYERDGATAYTQITPARIVAEDGSEFGQVGIMVKIPEWPENMIQEHRYGVVGALMPALQQTWKISTFTLDSLKKMVMGLLSTKNLSGPITIAKAATASAKSGLESYISFLALLSISLGVLNLLPIPVLDGGHLLFYVIELVKGSPVPERIQMLGFQLGFSIIIGVMMLALYNDFSRL